MKRLFRAEPGCLLAYNLTVGAGFKISGNNLIGLEQWLETGKTSDFIIMLIEFGLLDNNMSGTENDYIKRLVSDSRTLQAPPRAMRAPEIMNIELTTRCPLSCPQCYCDLGQGKDISKEVACKYINQAIHLKVPYINLSGGETLVYPHLTDLIELISAGGLSSAIAISGWGFDSAVLEELKGAGLDEIYVSLNGSTREVNASSRQGYDEAVHALELLRKDREIDYYINWVARNDNVRDFSGLVCLAQDMGVKGIIILESKPDAGYVLQEPLTRESFIMLADCLKKHDQKEISIQVEPCFSPLRAYISNYALWNSNTGINKGCGAGRNTMAVDVEGNLIPCRHLLYPERHDTIENYWCNSELLHRLRAYEDNRQGPCSSCHLNNYCISCRATADKVEKDLYSGLNNCPARGMED